MSWLVANSDFGRDQIFVVRDRGQESLRLSLRAGPRHTGLRHAYSFRICLVILVALAVGCFAQKAVQKGTASSRAASYRIAGTVVDAGSGEILAGAVVSVGKAQSADTLFSARTEEDGKFRFDGIEAGKYWLRAEARGFSQQGFDEHQGFFTGIVTGGSVDSEHLVFQLRPDASISGDVVDEANEPVRDAQMILFRRQTQDGREVTSWHSTATTNDEGHYRFGHLQAGTYFVAVRAHPWYAQNQRTLRVNTAGSVGRVGMNVVVTNDSTNEATTEEPANEAPSKAERDLDVAYPVTFYPGATEESGASPLELQAGDRATADFRLTAVPAVHVRLVVPGVEPGEGHRADIMQKMFDAPEQPVQGQIMMGDKGETEISGIAPGDYEVKVQTFGKNPGSWSERVPLLGDADLTLSPNKTAAAAVVKGVVKLEGADQKLPRGAFVQLWNRATDKRYATQVGENGEFDLSGQDVAPGKYEVGAGTPTAIGGRVSRIAASGARVAGQNVEIVGAGAVQLTITLGRGFGTVNGTVLQDDKPVAGAMVALVPQDLENNLPLVRRDQSDLDGTFTLRAVVPGKYTVVAIQNGWEMDWMNPQVLGRYLKGGRSVSVAADGKYEVKVGVE